MKKIIIHEEFASEQEIASALFEICQQIEKGFTSGYYPAWELTEVTETENSDEQ